MKFFLAIVLQLSVCLTINAQSKVQSFFGSDRSSLKNSWQISFTASPDRTKNIVSTIYVTAADTIERTSRDDNRLRLLSRGTDTLSVEGFGTNVYYSEGGYGNNGVVELEAPEVRIRFSLEGHYRLANNIEIGLGINHLSYDRERRIKPTDNLPDDFFYFVSNDRITSTGLVASLAYQLLDVSRFQAHVGLRTFWNIRTFETSDRRLESPFVDDRFDRPTNSASQKSTILDLNLELMIGLGYRLSDRFTVGLEFNPATITGPYYADFQARYVLSR